MNKKIMIVAVVFVAAGFVEAWPSWLCSSKRSVDAVRPQACSPRRHSGFHSDVVGEVVTRQNPYCEAKKTFDEAPSKLRAAARGARRGGRQLEQVYGQAKDQHSSDFARTHGDIRRDAGRMMMKTHGEAKDAFDGAAVLEENAKRARVLRKEARKRFKKADKKMKAWAVREDENPTAL